MDEEHLTILSQHMGEANRVALCQRTDATRQEGDRWQPAESAPAPACQDRDGLDGGPSCLPKCAMSTAHWAAAGQCSCLHMALLLQGWVQASHFQGLCLNPSTSTLQSRGLPMYRAGC